MASDQSMPQGVPLLEDSGPLKGQKDPACHLHWNLESPCFDVVGKAFDYEVNKTKFTCRQGKRRRQGKREWNVQNRSGKKVAVYIFFFPPRTLRTSKCMLRVTLNPLFLMLQMELSCKLHLFSY